jgi:glutaredoxin 3
MSESEQPLVRMYSTRFCPYCVRARMLLKRKGVEFEDIPVGNNPELWDEMSLRSGRDTVPQIFINEHHVGGYDDLAAANRSGELDKLLGLS